MYVEGDISIVEGVSKFSGLETPGPGVSPTAGVVASPMVVYSWDEGDSPPGCSGVSNTSGLLAVPASGLGTMADCGIQPALPGGISAAGGGVLTRARNGQRGGAIPWTCVAAAHRSARSSTSASPMGDRTGDADAHRRGTSCGGGLLLSRGERATARFPARTILGMEPGVWVAAAVADLPDAACASATM